MIQYNNLFLLDDTPDTLYSQMSSLEWLSSARFHLKGWVIRSLRHQGLNYLPRNRSWGPFYDYVNPAKEDTFSDTLFSMVYKCLFFPGSLLVCLYFQSSTRATNNSDCFHSDVLFSLMRLKSPFCSGSSQSCPLTFNSGRNQVRVLPVLTLSLP